MLGFAIFTLIAGVTFAQNMTEPCDLGVFMTNQGGQPVGAFGPIYLLDVQACYDECVASGCACTVDREDGCTLNAASDCDIQSRCCWFRFWQEKTLTDVNPDDPEGRSWGQYFCDLSYDYLAIPDEEIYALTLEMAARWRHCGNTAIGVEWEAIDNGEQNYVPELVCCDQLHNFLNCNP